MSTIKSSTDLSDIVCLKEGLNVVSKGNTNSFSEAMSEIWNQHKQ